MIPGPVTTPGCIPDVQKTQRWDNGLVLIHDFITPDEESTMMAAFHNGLDPATTAAAAAPHAPSRGRGRKRVSQHFGYHFDYTTFGASTAPCTPVPDYVLALLPRLPRPAADARPPDQFTAQWYPPSAGIPPHVDTHSAFAEALYSVSYGSDVPMSFRKVTAADARRMRLPKRSLMSSAELEACRAGSGSGSGAVAAERNGDGNGPDAHGHGHEADGEAEAEAEASWEIMLPRRSLLVMTGAARYGYTHGIRARKTDVVDGKTVPRRDRYSLTMRTVRRGDEVGCDCEFPGVCDARIREEMGPVS